MSATASEKGTVMNSTADHQLDDQLKKELSPTASGIEKAVVVPTGRESKGRVWFREQTESLLRPTSLLGLGLGWFSKPSNRFKSFAPVRQGAYQVKWLVDGQQHMSEVADAIKAARHEIFITDWQIHPCVHLKRPDTGVTSLEWRLDKLLLKKASEGVRIYVLLYWEPSKKLMDLGSDFAMSVLKHENITIFRHPNWASGLLEYQWSHHEKLVVVDRSIAFVGGIDLCFGRWDTHGHPLTDNYPHHPCALEKNSHKEETADQYCQWVGKDYGNTFLAGDRTDYDKPLDDILDKESRAPIRNEIPRMPWHDVSCVFTGDAVLDVAKHFIERFNAISQILAAWLAWGTAKLTETWDHTVQHVIENPCANNVRIQVVRSTGFASPPSLADFMFPSEGSIHTAYLDAIENAKHSIYIENQFFISSLPGKVRNQIQAALANRIIRADKNNEQFHVMIVIPLKNEFPEKWCTTIGSPLESAAYLTYATLFRGKASLFSKLEKQGVNAGKYVSVYGLRKYDSLGEKLVTELIYVHSKLMIVDDRLTIVGSANINDRSMQGNRDSEVCVVIEDREMAEGRMNGKPFKVGRFSHTLRCHLMNEHLGNAQSLPILEEGVEQPPTERDTNIPDDPINEAFLKEVDEAATQNTNIYEVVFKGRILPTDQVKTESDLPEWIATKGLADTNPEEARELLSRVRGHIVTFPRDFLRGKSTLFTSATGRVNGGLNPSAWDPMVALQKPRPRFRYTRERRV